MGLAGLAVLSPSLGAEDLLGVQLVVRLAVLGDLSSCLVAQLGSLEAPKEASAVRVVHRRARADRPAFAAEASANTLREAAVRLLREEREDRAAFPVRTGQQTTSLI